MSKRAGLGFVAAALGTGILWTCWRKLLRSIVYDASPLPRKPTLLLLDDPDASSTEYNLPDLVKAHIETVHNYPSPGQVYIDATRCSTVASIRPLVCDWFHCDAQVVVSVEARGMLLGNAVAQMFDLDFVPVRQHRKAPNSMDRARGRVTDTDSFRSHQTLVLQGNVKGKTVAVYDDVVSSGGTMGAVARIVESAGGHVVDMACIAHVGSKPVTFNGVSLRHIVQIDPPALAPGMAGDIVIPEEAPEDTSS